MSQVAVDLPQTGATDVQAITTHALLNLLMERSRMQEYTADANLLRRVSRRRASASAAARAPLSLSHGLSVISSSLSERRLRESLSAPFEYLGEYLGSLSSSLCVQSAAAIQTLAVAFLLNMHHAAVALRDHSRNAPCACRISPWNGLLSISCLACHDNTRTSIEEEDCDEEAHGLGLLDRLPQSFRVVEGEDDELVALGEQLRVADARGRVERQQVVPELDDVLHLPE